ncbi:MAG: tRNA pseudouridine(55) synthase, partial [Bacteroidales bacterium]|nr:tRNA pseudouridine(55) synthase [Bacteroidales bacterium]
MNRQFDFETGEILLFDKPYKWTSFDVVNKLRVFLKYYCHNPKIKVGHAGTLDPLATGLVIV